MKHIISLFAVVALAAACATTAQAAKPGKEKKGRRGSIDLVAAYDKNASGTVDGAELDEVRKDFAAGKAELKALDTNGDGTLSDQEIAAASQARRKGKKK